MGKKKVSNSVALIISVVVSILICVGFIAGLTEFILSDRIGERGAEISVNLIVVLSTVFSGTIGLKLLGDRPNYYHIIHAAVLLSIMITSGLIIDGEFENILSRAGSVIIGGVLCTLSINSGKRRGKKKVRYR